MALAAIVWTSSSVCSDSCHLVFRQPGQLAKRCRRGNVEVHAAAGLVGMAAIEHQADEAADVGDRRGRSWLAPYGHHPERGHVIVESRQLACGQIEIVHAKLLRSAEDVVIDIGDVAHATRLVADIPQPTLQDVVGQERRSMTEMSGVVRCYPARVHRDDRPARFERSELA